MSILRATRTVRVIGPVSVFRAGSPTSAGCRGHGCMQRLQQALRTSWDRGTAYRAAEQPGNPALGQCYPTSRVVQHFFPAVEILKGTVWTGRGEEVHFWNGLPLRRGFRHIDLTREQFPAGTVVRGFTMLDRRRLDDTGATLRRCSLLLERVERFLLRPVPDGKECRRAGTVPVA